MEQESISRSVCVYASVQFYHTGLKSTMRWPWICLQQKLMCCSPGKPAEKSINDQHHAACLCRARHARGAEQMPQMMHVAKGSANHQHMLSLEKTGGIKAYALPGPFFVNSPGGKMCICWMGLSLPAPVTRPSAGSPLQGPCRSNLLGILRFHCRLCSLLSLSAFSRTFPPVPKISEKNSAEPWLKILKAKVTVSAPPHPRTSCFCGLAGLQLLFSESLFSCVNHNML